MCRINLLRRKQFLLSCTIAITVILGMQLYASTAWTADIVNEGPDIAILQLSGDSDTDWAVNDLIERFSTFISDDIFLPDRIRVIRTNNPRVALTLDEDIVIYASHGGPFGIVTGKHITSWKTMAGIVEESPVSLHLFMACCSREIVKYGDDDSGKKLYTVIGARPAEVTNVEITSTAMLAVGLHTDYVEEYRIEELTKAKELVQTGTSVHIMDFSQIILDEIEYIDDTYSDTYTSEHMVIRFSNYTVYGTYDFSLLPSDLSYMLIYYYGSYWDDGEWQTVLASQITTSVNYTMNWYYESTWIEDIEPPENPPPPPPPPDSFSMIYVMAAAGTGGHWEDGPTQFAGGTYYGTVGFDYSISYGDSPTVEVTASGSDLDQVDSIALNETVIHGLYVSKQKVDGVWQEPVTGRNPGRSGGLWTDPCVKVEYDYDASWPVFPSCTAQNTGDLYCDGNVTYPVSIPSSPSGWRGPSFVRTLPSYFKLRDLGSFSVNLTIEHNNDGRRGTYTCVSLYDENKDIMASLFVYDSWTYSSSSPYQRERFVARYYKASGSYEELVSDDIYGDYSGIVQIRFDRLKGLSGDVPTKSEQVFFTPITVDQNRIIKYVVIQSYRNPTSYQHHVEIDNVRVSFCRSEYTVFNDNCNDMDGFNKDLDFGYGTSSDGEFVVPSGESYMTPDQIPIDYTGWHGPDFVHVLSRPFRLYQLTEFSVNIQMVQSSNTMGKMYVALFDENKNIIMLVYIGDAQVGAEKAVMRIYFYPEGSSTCSYSSGYIYNSGFTKTAKLWFDEGMIKGDIEGVGQADLGVSYNYTRVVKYVVLLGYRYKYYNLVDMRIHNINVECKLNMQKPDDIYPPEQATGLAADQPSGSEQIDLTWNANPEPDVTRYSVYRKVGDGAFTKIAEIQGTSYTDTALQEFTSYTYAVAAVDRSGNEGDQSSSVGLSTGSFGNPPDEVEDVTATTLSHDEIEVTWTANDEPDMDHYCIYRDGIKVGEVDHPTTTFTDSGLEPETTYSYRVSAVDNEGNEGPLSDPDSATTQAEPPPDNSFDGTGKPSDDDLNTADQQLSVAMSLIVMYWTGWWPLLHYIAESPETSLTVLHVGVDLLGATTVFYSESMGLTAEDFNNAIQVTGFAFMVGLWLYALMVTGAVAEKSTGWGWIIVAASMMIFILGLAWFGAHNLVDSGKWTAGAAALYFVVLAFICFCVAAGFKKLGGITITLIFGLLAFIMDTTTAAIIALATFTVWTKAAFVILAIVFLIYAVHFYTYEG